MPPCAVSMLADATGSEALRAAAGEALTQARFNPRWVSSADLIPLEDGDVSDGEVAPRRGAFVIPARLLPTGVVAGAKLETFVEPWGRCDDEE